MQPDLASIIGVLAGFGLILLGQILEGGHVSSILQPTAALIVFGGTLGATMTCFPLSVAIGALKRFMSVFFGAHHNAATLAKELLEYAALSRKEGLLALQKFQPNIKEEFLSKGLQLVIDAVPEKALREMMEREMTEAEQHDEHPVKFFEAAGGFAPTVGIIGAVLGLIHVMENLADPSTLGAGIAVAFVATIYGVASANLLFLPASAKLKHHKEANNRRRELILDALVAIQQGENPAQLKERLKGYLSHAERASLEK